MKLKLIPCLIVAFCLTSGLMAQVKEDKTTSNPTKSVIAGTIKEIDGDNITIQCGEKTITVATSATSTDFRNSKNGKLKASELKKEDACICLYSPTEGKVAGKALLLYKATAIKGKISATSTGSFTCENDSGKTVIAQARTFLCCDQNMAKVTLAKGQQCTCYCYTNDGDTICPVVMINKD